MKKPLSKDTSKDKNLLRYRIDLYLYTLLLIFTPFLMLINYLQQAIGDVSNFRINFYFFKLPLPILMGLVVIILIAFFHIGKLNLIRITGWIIVTTMVLTGYISTDYYMAHAFYELQQNWHYIAYALFAMVYYRYIKAQGASDVKILWKTWSTALFVSALDELIQVFLTNRIFDPCDIAKDSWGTLMGLVIIFVIIFNGRIFKEGWIFRHRNIKDYFRHPVTSFFLLFVITYLFLIISSILTESRYLPVLFSIITGTWLLFFLVLHYSQFKITGWSMLGIFITSVVLLGINIYKNRAGFIQSKSVSLVIYRGIPIPYFDVMIFPDGRFRLVDKKLDFTNMDKKIIFGKNPDILLLGTGSRGKGGNGMGEEKEVQFIYNTRFKRAVQLVKLKTPEACETYNRLKKSGYSVQFIINNN